jgi:hypothetical protein
MKISKILLTFSFIAGINSFAHSQVNSVILEDQEAANITVLEEPKIIYPYELIVFDERDKKE